MPVRELVVHVGFPKTGTTTLQSNLFETRAGFAFFGKYGAKSLGVEGFEDRSFIDLRDLANNATTDVARRRAPALVNRVAERLAAAPEPIGVLSAEGFCNPFVDTHYPLLKDIRDKARHIAIVAEELARHDIVVKILLTFRRYQSFIPSLYSQAYFHCFTSGLVGRSYDEFLDFIFDDELIDIGGMLRFDAMWDLYESLFGAERVLGVAMEDLLVRQDPQSIAALGAFLGAGSDRVGAALGSRGRNIRRSAPDSTVYSFARRSRAASLVAKRMGVDLSRHAFGLRRWATGLRGAAPSVALPDRSARIGAYYAESVARLLENRSVDLR